MISMYFHISYSFYFYISIISMSLAPKLVHISFIIFVIVYLQIVPLSSKSLNITFHRLKIFLNCVALFNRAVSFCALIFD